jgi:hypothetical protein
LDLRNLFAVGYLHLCRKILAVDTSLLGDMKQRDNILHGNRTWKDNGREIVENMLEDEEHGRSNGQVRKP